MVPTLQVRLNAIYVEGVCNLTKEMAWPEGMHDHGMQDGYVLDTMLQYGMVL